MKMSSSFISQEAERKLLVVVFLILYALFTFRAYVWQDFHLKVGDQRYSTTHSADFSIAKPFAFRVLLPGLSAALQRMLPLEACEMLANNKRAQEKALYNSLNPPPTKQRGELYDIKTLETVCRVTIIRVLMGFFLIGAVGGTYLFASTIFGKMTLEALITPLVILVGLSLSPKHASRFYDAPALAFMALLCWLMVKQKWRWFLVIYGIACFNKETIIMVTFLFALWCFDTMPRKQWIKLLISQVIIFMTIRLYLFYLFSGNPGSVIVWHLDQHLHYILLGRYNIPDAMGYFTLLFMIGFKWTQKPVLLKRSMPVVLGVVGLWIIGGMPGELRVFHEFYPLIIPLVVHTLITTTELNQARLFRSLDRSDESLARATHVTDQNLRSAE